MKQVPLDQGEVSHIRHTAMHLIKIGTGSSKRVLLKGRRDKMEEYSEQDLRTHYKDTGLTILYSLKKVLQKQEGK